MAVQCIEVLVEEQSMEEALRHLLPKVVGPVRYKIYPHQGKPALLQRLPDRLKGYRAWLPSNYLILIIVDRDRDDCIQLKARIETMATQAGFGTRARPGRQGVEIVTRIAIEELEAWYFGDWKAVLEAYPGVAANVPGKSRYRDPDAIAGGTWEAFERVLKRAGHHATGLPKIEAARRIAPLMDPARNTSPSFQKLFGTLSELCSA